ncbi:nuclear transport factor 2 family protein [Staphylococcus kloosii]|uniref:nuclear transport factor 2 family protein n=1 Tax=Staphylococcus kloosii TaxID=29384 RepID=UPI0028A455E8|nr:nuclear transport factor 2 family protein [Staphylococcus kloosii]MDT3959379.1 nuclear transport factor 2 family protein [Staphylococcus kloosii]
MSVLDNYFKLFDEAKESEESFNNLNALFSDDVTFVLNGSTFNGKKAWENFVKQVFDSNKELKHMYNGWEQNEDGTYATKWAICGNRYKTGVYTQEGIDIARLDSDGKIIYLENKPNNSDFLS